MSEILQYILGGLTILSFGIGIIKYLLDRQEKSDKDMRIDFNTAVDTLRKEISDIKETYVKSEVHNRHAEAVERQIRDVSTMVSNMSTSINVRLDNLFTAVTGGKK